MRIDPSDLATFLAIARHRSFRAAATELGVSLNVVYVNTCRVRARVRERCLRDPIYARASE